MHRIAFFTFCSLKSRTMEHRYHSELERRLGAYLRARGFPEESIVYEPVLAPIDARRSYRPDFAIVDPERREWLAVIEVKGAIHHSPSASVGAQLQAYATALGKRSLPLFLITPGAGSEPFSVARIEEEGGALVDLPPDQFPTFESLRAATQASQKDVASSGVREATDALRTLCHSSAGLAFLLVCADTFVQKRYDFAILTAERLTLLGMTAALLLIPYAAKLKAFGLEFERAIEKASSVGSSSSDPTKR